ncbi:MAG: DNA replication/repair protein RecF [Firmicutes bacterium HGW-Firmicutes-12]|nr:MAG: DNA replication/repair protein RecF [Firmicutes bacterium HGW-Firmicutes-12]
MYIENFKLIKYRNYDYIDENFSKNFNILIGLNAQGKTNLLEAIYYLSTGKSYRPVRDNDLIKWNSNFFNINGIFCNCIGKIQLEIIYKNTDIVNKEVRINGIKKNKISELLGNFTSVLFAPEDLYIIKGSPADRRRLLDNDIAQVSPVYFIKMQKYNRILNQRNSLLRKICKNRGSIDELEIWNQQFIELSKDIIQRRLKVLEKLVPLTRLMQRKLTNGEENLEIKYLFSKKEEIKSNNDIDELLNAEYENLRKEEIIRGITLFGPHRDDYSILLNGMNLKSFGSQGQHRTAVLAIKLAELEFFKAETGEYPVLLLDDVLSELDKNRREHLIQTIKNKEIQCFITTTENLTVELDNSSAKRFNINQGKLIEM